MTKSSVYWLYLISWPKLTYQLICWLHVCKNNKYKEIIIFISLLFLHVLFFLCFCIFYLFAFLCFLLFLCINSWPLGSGFVHVSRFTLSCIFTLFCIFWLLRFYSISFFVGIASAGEFLFLYFCMLCKRNS